MNKKQRNNLTYYSTKKITSTSPIKKYLTVILMVLLAAVLNSCIETQKTEILPVPALNQWYMGWCAAACVQMWANYQDLNPEQDEIVDVTGYYGSNPILIAHGVTQFTQNPGYPEFYTSGGRDLAISSQVSSIDHRIPSISIVNDGFHAVIVKGYKWTEMEDFRPRADGIHFNDPIDGISKYRTVGVWKAYWFTSYDGGTNWAVVYGGSVYAYSDEGERGLQEFHDRDGYCYGEDPDGDPDDPGGGRDIEV